MVTEAAQLGIRPISADRQTPTTGRSVRTLSMVPTPAQSISAPRTREIAKTKAVMFSVWTSAERVVAVAAQPQHPVDGHPGEHADDGLGEEHPAEGPGGDVLRQKDRQHFVRRRQEHREQRPGGDEPAGVEARGRSGEAALGDDPDRRAGRRPKGPDPKQQPCRVARGLALEILHDPIGHEEEGDELDGVDRRVTEDV